MLGKIGKINMKRTLFGTSRAACFNMNDLVIGRTAKVSEIDAFHGNIFIDRRVGEEPVKVAGVPLETHYKKIATEHHPEGLDLIFPFDPYSRGYIIFHKIPIVVLAGVEQQFKRLEQEYNIKTLGHGLLEKLSMPEMKEIFLDTINLWKHVKEETSSLDALAKLPLTKSDKVKELLDKLGGDKIG